MGVPDHMNEDTKDPDYFEGVLYGTEEKEWFGC